MIIIIIKPDEVEEENWDFKELESCGGWIVSIISQRSASPFVCLRLVEADHSNIRLVAGSKHSRSTLAVSSLSVPSFLCFLYFPKPPAAVHWR